MGPVEAARSHLACGHLGGIGYVAEATCVRVLFGQVQERNPYQMDTRLHKGPQDFPANSHLASGAGLLPATVLRENPLSRPGAGLP